MKKSWFHILLVVADGPTYGADIQRRVTELTDGEVTLYPVTLYRALDDLSGLGLIEETPEPHDADHNENRRYYVIAAEGKRALAAEAQALESAARMARAALQPGSAR